MLRIRSRFLFKLAIQHARYSWKWSLVLLFSLSLLFSMILMSFSAKPALELYYYDHQESIYSPYTHQLTLDQNSNARFFSITQLNNYHSLHFDAFEYVAFFESTMLIRSQDAFDYIHVFASDLPAFRQIVSTTYVHDNLLDHEIIVSQSYAEKHHLNIADKVILMIGNVDIEYTVVSIEPEQGLFRNQSAFVNKASLIRPLISTISPSFSNLPDSALINLNNVVYIQNLSDTSFVVDQIKTLANYTQLTLEPSINYEAIDQLISRNAAFFELIMALVIVSVSLVMFITISVHNQSVVNRNQVLVHLGARRVFMTTLTLIEWGFYSVVSMGVGSFIAHVFLNMTITSFSPNLSILVKSDVYLLTFTFLIMLIFLGNVMPRLRIKELHVASRVLFVLYITLLICLGYLIYAPRHLILSVLVIIMFVMLTPKVYVAGIDALKPRLTYTFMFMKALTHIKGFKVYMVSNVLILASIGLMLHANIHINKRIDDFSDEYALDLIMTRFSGQASSIKTAINDTYDVEFVDTALYFQDVYLPLTNDSIQMLVSMDNASILNHFNVNISEDSLARLSQNEEPHVLLPDRFHYVHHLAIGDSIYIKLNNERDAEAFVIAGFFSKVNDNLAFISFHETSTLSSFAHNALFIKAGGDVNQLRQALLRQYSPQLVYIISTEDIAHHVFSDMNQALGIMNAMLLVISIGFVFGLINQTRMLYLSLAPTVELLRVLGMSSVKLLIQGVIHMVIEGVVFMTLSGLLYMGVVTILTPLALHQKQYEVIKISDMHASTWFLTLIMVFLVSKSVFVTRLYTTKAVIRVKQ